jgi:hypothetical protein
VEVRFALIADAAVRREIGKLDIFGAGIETIFATTVPAVHPALTVALWLLLDRDEAAEPHQFELRIDSPGDELIAAGQGDVPAVSPEQLDAIGAQGHVGAPLLLPITNLVLPEFGTYQVRVLWDGDPLWGVPVEVAPLPPDLAE